SVVRCGNPQSFADPSWPAAKKSYVAQAAAAAHQRQARGRLQRPNEDGAGRTLGLADEVKAPVDAVGAVNVGVAWGPEHHRIAGCRPPVAMRGRIGVVIAPHFDQPAADTVEEQRRPDQVGRHLVNAAAKEGFGQASGHAASLQTSNTVVNRSLTE